MPDPLPEFLQELAHNSELQATMLVAVVALLGILYMLRARTTRWWREHNTNKIIKRLGAQAIRNIQLPDGTGGEVTIEHLLLGRNGFIIVGIMRFDGLIFGGRLTDQWTQVLGRRSYKFDNPNHYLQRQINAINQIVPGTPVSGRHLFNNAKFPKDKPDSVLLLNDLKSLPERPRQRDIPDQSTKPVLQRSRLRISSGLRIRPISRFPDQRSAGGAHRSTGASGA